MNAETLRSIFPITQSCIYLDNGSRCPIPEPVMKRQEAFLRFCSYQGRDYGTWWQTADALRGRLANLIHASPEEIGYGDSTTHALNILAQGFPWKAGDNIVTANGEFPSNVYPWLGTQSSGVEVRFAVPQEGAITVEALKACVDNHTRIIALSHVQAGNGYRLDLEEIGCFCQTRGIVFCVDATQSLGAYPVDVEKCHVDFLACSTYKWLMGSDGLAFFYCSERLLPRLKRVFLGWSGRSDRNEFYQYPISYPKAARSFEMGNPNFSSLIALEAAMDLRDTLTHQAILAKTAEVVECFKETLRSVRGSRIFGDYDAAHQGALITLQVPDAPRIHHALTQLNVSTALRRDGIRISPYFYNTSEEACQLARILHEQIGCEHT